MSTLVVNAIENSDGDARFQPTAGTAQATTSGTSFDFMGIPSWVTRVTMVAKGVSTSGANEFMWQLGDAGGIETAGYVGVLGFGGSGADSQMDTDGFNAQSSVAAAGTYTLFATFVLVDSATNTWAVELSTAREDAAALVRGTGSKALSGPLTQIRLTTDGGADTFDAGTANIIYE